MMTQLPAKLMVSIIETTLLMANSIPSASNFFFFWNKFEEMSHVAILVKVVVMKPLSPLNCEMLMSFDSENDLRKSAARVCVSGLFIQLQI